MAHRILQLGKFYPPELGGVEAVTANLAEGFAAQGFGSRVLAFTRHASESVQVNGVEVSRCRASIVFRSQPISFRWMVKAVCAARRATCVLVHWPNPLAALTLLFIQHANIVTFWHAGVINKGWFGLITRPLARYLLGRSDLVLVTSDAVAKTPEFARVREKVAVLPLGITDPAARPCGPIPERIDSFLAGRQYAFSVGRLVRYKGFDQLIAAASALPADIAVVIAGGGPLRHELERMVAAMNLSDRVLIAGRLDERELNAAFANASVFVLPSIDKAEAFGVVQLEAMAHGLPVIATDIPESGSAWVSGFGELGALVPVGSPESMSRAIQQIVTSPARTKLGAKSRERFERMFTADRMVQRAVRLICHRERRMSVDWSGAAQ